MYSLDVNFLNDRTIRPSEAGPSAPRAVQSSQAPLFVGVAVGILLPALAAGLWFFLQTRNAKLQTEIAELDSQLAAAQAQLQEVNTIRQQVDQMNQQNQALATVFDRIKPWSAILQDVRGRVPTGMQLDSIEQKKLTPVAAPPPPPAPADGSAPPPAPPPAVEKPSTVIQISGVARNFDEVNDFLLTLQQSPFLEPELTKILAAELIDDPTRIEFREDVAAQVEVELPKVVRFTVVTTLTNLPTSQLMQDLERNLAVGLAARIEELRSKGVIQQ
jgi:type IV pilus assembly protein PilN